MILQSMVSILNLSARRIAKDDERDLEQGKLGSTPRTRSSTWSRTRPSRSSARRSPSCRSSTQSTRGRMAATTGARRREARARRSEKPEPERPKGDSGPLDPAGTERQRAASTATRLPRRRYTPEEPPLD